MLTKMDEITKTYKYRWRCIVYSDNKMATSDWNVKFSWPIKNVTIGVLQNGIVIYSCKLAAKQVSVYSFVKCNK